jgi:hypothetical protein
MGLRPTFMDEKRGESKPYDGTGVGRRRPSLLWIFEAADEFGLGRVFGTNLCCAIRPCGTVW